MVVGPQWLLHPQLSRQKRLQRARALLKCGIQNFGQQPDCSREWTQTTTMGLMRTLSRITGPKSQVDRFFIKYRPPKEMYKFARRYDKLAQVWRECSRSDWMLWMIACIEYKPTGGLRAFAAFCARQFADLITDPRSQRCIEVADKFGMGEATMVELEDARRAAYDVLAEAKRRNDKLGELLAWSAAATAKDDAFTAANDTAEYASDVATLRGGKTQFYRVREVQARKLRELLDNPFTED